MPKTGTPLRVLIVEDSEDDAALLLRELRKSGYDPASERVDTAEAMRAALKGKPWDIILSDYMIPGFGGLEALRITKESGLDLPFVVISGKVGEEKLVDVMKAGASDFLVKGHLERLGLVIKRELADASARREAKRAQQAALEQFKLAEVFFNHSVGGLVILDRNFNFIRVNEAYARACRKDIGEFAGRNHFEMYPSDTQAIFEEVVRTRQPYVTFTRAFVFPDQPERGTTYWDWTLVPILDRHGEVEYLVFSLNEITERKRAEEGLLRVNRALRTLSRCNEALVRASDEAVLLDDMCRIAVETGGYRMAWVGFAEYGAGKAVRPVAYFGFEEGYLERSAVTWADTPRGNGPAGTAIREGKPQFVSNTATDPRFAPWRADAIKHNYGSTIALPLLSEGKAFGIFAIYAHEHNAFDENEIKLLEELVNDLAYGIMTLRMRTAHQISMEQLQRSMEATVQAIAATVETRDPYTAGHQRRVAELVVAIAAKLGLSNGRIHALRLAATIHDLGKVQIPAEILSKPGKLTEIEFSLMKVHPQAGCDILKGVEFPWPIADMVLQHHERLDGSGYPQGLKGEQILFEARILAVADVVEAMSSHRPYRPELGIAKALSEIERGRGSVYDPAVVDACVELFRNNEFSWA